MRGINWRTVDIATTVDAVASAMLGIVAADTERFEVGQIKAAMWCLIDWDLMVDLDLLALATQVGLATSTSIPVYVQCFLAETEPAWLLVEAPCFGCTHLSTRRDTLMSKVSDLARELRNHSTEDHARGCSARMQSCECGYDRKTERLLRAAATRIDELDAMLRGRRERAALEREHERE